MKACRILILDSDEREFTPEPIVAALSAANANLHIVYSTHFCPSKNLDSTARTVWRVDPRVIVLTQGNLFHVYSFLHAIRKTRSDVAVIICIEEMQATILQLSDGEIRDMEMVPMTEIGRFDFRGILDRTEGRHFMQSMREKLGLRTLIGESECFISEVKKIPPIAETDSTVLITGETGTGKEVFARAIHYLSARRDKPFMPVNCGAIPAELVENEFFGHEAGAYTTASARATGVIKQADGGTLFLDEINCLPLLTQTKLLRFIQEKEYKPLGSSQTQKADVRIIAAANEDLEQAVKEGRFRKDLFYRLNIIPIHLPSLRERTDDIPLLARHFLIQCSERLHKHVDGFTHDAMTRLLSHNWEGNIRELEYVVERTVVFAEGMLVCESDINFCANDSSPKSFREAKRQVVDQMEKGFIQGLLISHQGNVTSAAKAAQKHPRAFWHLIYKHEINVEKYRTKVA
jgi:two-component system response regulator GlrR